MEPNELDIFRERVERLEKQNRKMKVLLALSFLIFSISLIILIYYLPLKSQELTTQNDELERKISGLNKKLLKYNKEFKSEKIIAKKYILEGDDGNAKFVIPPEDQEHEWDPYMLVFDPGGKAIWEEPKEYMKDIITIPSAGTGTTIENRSTKGNAIEKISGSKEVIFKKGYEKCLKEFKSDYTQARIVPNLIGHGDGSFIEGIRITRIQPGSFFQCLGLHNGDIIKSVNKEKIANLERFMQGMRTIIDGEPGFSVEIERQGELFEIELYESTEAQTPKKE